MTEKFGYNCNDFNGSQPNSLLGSNFSLKTLRAHSVGEDEFSFTRFSFNIFAKEISAKEYSHR